jgi:hypothetical protein
LRRVDPGRSQSTERAFITITYVGLLFVTVYAAIAAPERPVGSTFSPRVRYNLNGYGVILI